MQVIGYPMVAVPADRRMLAPHPSHVSGEKYLKALIDGAATFPAVVPVLADRFSADDVLERFDGLFLTGSYSDIESHRYDAESVTDSIRDPERDELTLSLVSKALAKGVPLLAVCRGIQEFNVALGGTLHQRVADVEGFHNHLENKSDPLEKQYGPSHSVTLPDGSLLRQLAGADTVMVNSLHGQAIARLADGLVVEALADDGLVEAVRMDETPGFNLAVQWHPEWRVTENAFSMAIFKAFGDACRQYAQQR